MDKRRGSGRKDLSSDLGQFGDASEGEKGKKGSIVLRSCQRGGERLLTQRPKKESPPSYIAEVFEDLRTPREKAS